MYPTNNDMGAWNLGQVPPAGQTPYPPQTGYPTVPYDQAYYQPQPGYVAAPGGQGYGIPQQQAYPGIPAGQGYGLPQQQVYPGAPAGQGYGFPQQQAYPGAPGGQGYGFPQQQAYPGAHGGQGYGLPQQQAYPSAPSAQGYGQSGQTQAMPSKATLFKCPNFNQEEDCIKLRKAMKGLGTDEAQIISVMSKRTADQRAQLVKQYKTMYGRDLIKDLKSELSGDFEDVVVAMCATADEFDARELRAAMKGWGTDEDTLIEILCTRSNAQINRIKETFKNLFKRDLEKDLKSETSGDFRKILVSLVQGNRDENPRVDMATVQRDAEDLYKAGEKRLGTDESTFNRILAAKSIPHVRAVMEAYGRIGKRDIEEAIKSEMSGDLERAHLAILRCIRNTPKYFAKELKHSMKGAGTDDRTLIRIVVSRCEVDMVDIKKEFEKENGKSLGSWISDDCSGDYKKMLLALI